MNCQVPYSKRQKGHRRKILCKTYRTTVRLSIDSSGLVPVVQNTPRFLDIGLIFRHHDVAFADIAVEDICLVECTGDC